MSALKLSFRPDIEGLRALAVGLVVVFHTGLSISPGGFVGVDVFFALSGYLITRLMLVEHAETQKIALLAFYARRARRLLPAMAVMLVATVVAGAILFAPLEQTSVAKTALATALYASNLYFGKRAVNYWDAGVGGDPLLHTWSLSVEEQFYFVWPPVLIAIFWFARKRRANHPKGLLIAITSLGVLVSFASAVALMNFIQPYAFFLPVSRAWEFGAGALLAIFGAFSERRERSDVPGVWPSLAVLLGISAILVGAFAYDDRTPFPGVTALLPVVGTLLCLRGGEVGPNTAMSRWLLQNRLMLFLGRVSYSWYLWHWPVFVFEAYAFGPPTWRTAVAGTLASLGLSVLSYRWVETPIRHHRGLVTGHKRSLVGAAGLTAVSVTFALGWLLLAGSLSRSDAHVRFVEARDDFPLMYDKAGCFVGVFDREPKGCTFETDAATANVFLVGDSHAAAWFPAIHELAKEHDWRLTVVTKTQCPMPDVDFVSTEVGRQYVECPEWRRKLIELLQSARPDLVFVASAQGYTLGSPPGVEETSWLEGFRRTLAGISPASKQVVVLRDTPLIGFDVPSCLSRMKWGGAYDWNGCTLDESEAYQDRLFERETVVAQEFPNVRMVDLSGEFCRDGICSSVIDGRIAFRDSNHMTASFSAGLKTRIEAAMSDRLVSP